MTKRLRAQFRVKQTLLQIPALPLINWVTLGNIRCDLCLLCLCDKMELVTAPTRKAVEEINELVCTKHLSKSLVYDNAQKILTLIIMAQT